MCYTRMALDSMDQFKLVNVKAETVTFKGPPNLCLDDRHNML